MDNFSGEYIVAVIDEDDSFDFDNELRVEMTKGLRLLYKLIISLDEKDRGRQLSWMMIYFANMIGKQRTNDDLLSVQIVTGPDVMEVIGEGAHYKITLKAA